MKYLFFWGHQPERDGGIGKGCLSQWWPCTFTADGQEFASAEHYMMWRKALLFDDASVASRVLAARTPGEAKALGRIDIDDPDAAAAILAEMMFGAVALKTGQGAEWPGGESRVLYMRQCIRYFVNGIKHR